MHHTLRVTGQLWPYPPPQVGLPDTQPDTEDFADDRRKATKGPKLRQPLLQTFHLPLLPAMYPGGRNRNPRARALLGLQAIGEPLPGPADCSSNMHSSDHLLVLVLAVWVRSSVPISTHASPQGIQRTPCCIRVPCNMQRCATRAATIKGSMCSTTRGASFLIVSERGGETLCWMSSVWL